MSNMLIYANFITNPFTPVAGLYNGLFYEESGVTHASAGFVNVNVKDKSGYSAYLLVDGDKVSFSGKLNAGGSVTRTVSRGLDGAKVGKGPLSVSLALDNFP